MDAFAGLIHGFGVALQPVNLLWGLVGVTLGTFVGVLPGVGPALTQANALALKACSLPGSGCARLRQPPESVSQSSQAPSATRPAATIAGKKFGPICA
jgi:hypothetical protein